jgi:glycine betaine catabolism A
MSDHIVTFSALPIDAEHTHLRTTWLAHKDAVEGVDYDLDNITKVWKATNKQDSTLVERTMRGVKSDQYKPGPYSPYTEELVEKFTNWYIQRLEASMANSAAVIPIKACK